jgi:D-beta-D-heptose 7-phosphate kinase/D-beta-D-heptose 1-phosphate adenosyltransferase
VTRAELAESIVPDAPMVEEEGGLVALEGAAVLRRRWARERLIVGFTNGCFDLLHPGHVALLQQAARSCDRLIVALNSDASVRRLKGAHRPVQSESARAAIIGAMKGVSAVLVFDEDTPRRIIEVLQPDVLIKGGDYTRDHVVGAEIVEARGGRVVLVDLVTGQSTSNLVRAAGSRASATAPLLPSAQPTGLREPRSARGG